MKLRKITRREFLVGLGASVLGSSLFNSLLSSGCSNKPSTSFSITMPGNSGTAGTTNSNSPSTSSTPSSTSTPSQSTQTNPISPSTTTTANSTTPVPTSGTPATPAPYELLNSTFIPKYKDPLRIPSRMPPADQKDWISNQPTYHIAARQFSQQVLPSTGYGLTAAEPFPRTTLWGYGPSGRSVSEFSWPAPIIEARRDEELWVRWDNQLVDEPASQSPHFIPHILPVDQTLLWANPPGPIDSFGTSNEPYRGPVPLVAHLHGGHVDPESDGYPQAWYLPKASDIPAGHMNPGGVYTSAIPAPEGSAWYMYRNDQPAATLWYHDNTLGISRLNVYAGLYGMYLLRDDTENSLNLPSGEFEIPLVVQDRSFRNDGSLYYPESRRLFDGFAGPYRPESEIPPIWSPGFFGNTICVNGKTWPYLEVKPALYRFRILNASDSRVFVLRFGKPSQGITPIGFAQIGADGGFLKTTAALDELIIAPGERVDALVNFSLLAPDTEVLLLNLGPDGPLEGLPVKPGNIADVETTGQVMKFRVIAGVGNDKRLPPVLPVIIPTGKEQRIRQMTINEKTTASGDSLISSRLGTVEKWQLTYGDELSEDPEFGSVEVWQIINLTGYSHPVHIHQIQFEVMGRIPFIPGQASKFAADQTGWIASGNQGTAPRLDDYLDMARASGPESGETGRKDTVLIHPVQVVQIKARFDIGGLYSWGSSMFSRLDNEAQRPFFVLS